MSRIQRMVARADPCIRRDFLYPLCRIPNIRTGSQSVSGPKLTSFHSPWVHLFLHARQYSLSLYTTHFPRFLEYRSSCPIGQLTCPSLSRRKQLIAPLVCTSTVIPVPSYIFGSTPAFRHFSMSVRFVDTLSSSVISAAS